MRAEERLLEAMNGIHEETVLRTGQLLENREEHKVRKSKKVWRTVLIAAIITSLLSVTAYAVSQFSMKGRTAAAGESFAWSLGEDVTGVCPSQYVFEFEGPAECRELEFRPTWAPNGDYWGPPEPGEDGWAALYEAKEIRNEEFGVFMPACVIDVCYAPEFIDGGALVLMDFTPQDIVEEDWDGGVKALKFAALSGHAIDAAQTEFPTGNFVILFHPEQGWIIGVRGYDSMENIEGIARGLEVRQLDKTLTKEDFPRNVEFCDIYIG